MARLNDFHLFSLTTLLLFLPCVLPTPVDVLPSAAAGRGFRFELFHRDTVHSSFYPGNITEAERIQRLVRLSRRNASWRASSVVNTSVIRPPVYYESRLYMVRVSVGTSRGAKTYFLVLDTASSLTWVHCLPCNRIPGLAPFEPDRSGTYRLIAASDPICRPPWTRLGNRCKYELFYSDGTHAAGDLSRETFTFETPWRGHSLAVPGLLFGCTHVSQVINNFRIPGIFSMSQTGSSFAAQLAASTGCRFSYCLCSQLPSQPTFLRFGADIPIRMHMQSTPLLSLPNHAGYYLSLLDISIEQRRMNLARGIFQVHPDGSGGVVIDSGSAFTDFIGPAYVLVMNELRRYFLQHGLQPIPGDHFGLQLCYQMPYGFERFMPTMTFHLQGGDLIVQWKELFYVGEVRNQKVFCVALMRDEHVTTVGAYQQANTRFVYDLPNRALYFSAEDCRLDRSR